jgi:asparagine synthetase B (glutamine-hydrolysing)
VLSWRILADFMRKAFTLGKFNRTHPSPKRSLNSQSDSVQQLRSHLSEALKPRILNIPLPPGLAAGHHVRVAVLFSGGLDCTVLARMAHDILPRDQHIDLINVAFENPRVVKAANSSKSSGNAVSKSGDGRASHRPSGPENEDLGDHSPFESCPDRETGRKAFRELQAVCPGRCWRFVAVSIQFCAY